MLISESTDPLTRVLAAPGPNCIRAYPLRIV